MNSRFIVFEGVCKAGKSTLGKELSQRIKSVYNKGVFSKTALGVSLKQEANLGSNLCDILYLTDLIIDTKATINPILKQGSNIIQDRYFYSVSAFSRAISKRNGDIYDVDTVIDKLRDCGTLITPKVLFYFFAEESELIKRMKTEPSEIHNLYVNNPIFLRDVLEEYEKVLVNEQKRGVKVFRIDTTNVSKIDILNELEQKLI